MMTIRNLFFPAALAILASQLPSIAYAQDPLDSRSELSSFASRVMPMGQPDAAIEDDLAALRILAREFAAQHFEEASEWRKQEIEAASGASQVADQQWYSFPHPCSVAYPELTIGFEDTGPQGALLLTDSLISQEIARLELAELGYPDEVIAKALAAYDEAERARVFTRLTDDEFIAVAQTFAATSLHDQSGFIDAIELMAEMDFGVTNRSELEADPGRVYNGFQLPEAVAATILNDYRRSNAPDLKPAFVLEIGCGLSTTPVTLTLEPDDGWGAVIPHFNYRFCKAAKKDLKALGECEGWVRFEGGDSVYLKRGADYFMVGRWPNGKKIETPIRVSNDTFRLRPE